MQCDHAQEFFSEYVAGEMDPALAVSLENHLAACAPCSGSVDGLRSLWGMLDEMPLVEPPASFHASVMERIAAEEMTTERAARMPARGPHAHRLVQPRLLAYAATLIVLLLGAEIVQVQRAALGPVGMILNLIHPSPVVAATAVQWAPDGQGGGALRVTLQAPARVDGAANPQHARIQILRKSGAALPNGRAAYVEGLITSAQPTTFVLPLEFTPSVRSDVLNVTLTPMDAASDDTQTIAIPLEPNP